MEQSVYFDYGSRVTPPGTVGGRFKNRKEPMSLPRESSSVKGIQKCPTGIRGLDEITGGGLPKGRPTLVCGGAGSGKTLLAMEFIVRGARQFGEPGVFFAFEETTADLAANVASLGFDLPALVKQKKLALDYVRIERSEIEETGEYDLEGLFVRLASAIDGVAAKRVALDSLEALFAGLPNEAILRAELRRLFEWLKKRGVSAVITAEQGRGSNLTRHGLEEYVSDCVILLDQRVANQIATRRLRIIKYRGSAHSANEYPTLIERHGLSVLPISSLGLSYPVSTRRVSTGIARLDAMLGGKGFFKGSSIMVSGTAGCGKSSIAASFADSVCARGERFLYCSTEESPEQLIRNMASIGIDLGRHVRSGKLLFHTVRPTLYGLETHLVKLHGMVEDFSPSAIVIDPVSNLEAIGTDQEIKAMLTRMIDFLKNRGVTTLFTALTGNGSFETTTVGISSLMDTWILLRMVESASERNRLLYVLKSRGMGHSNQMREFVLSDRGIGLVDVYAGPGAVYTGTERINQEARDKAAGAAARRNAESRGRELAQQGAVLRAQIASLQAQLAAVVSRRDHEGAEEGARLKALNGDRAALTRARRAD